MKAEVRAELLRMLSSTPIIATRHAACLFPDSGSPLKRASAALKELEAEKMIEGRRMGDMTKVWRLSRRGRTELEIQRRSIPLGSMKLNHYLAIADLYVILSDKLKYFEVELREQYERLGKIKTYSPDALFVYDRGIYIAEVQLKRLSRKEWARKWSKANEFFNERYFEEASWQRWRRGDNIKPQFLCVSEQDPGIVMEGFSVSGRVLKVLTINDVSDLHRRV